MILTLRHMNSSDIVRQAIQNTKRRDPKYWSKVLRQRAGKTESGKINKYAVGSMYELLSPKELEVALLNAQWRLYKNKNLVNNVRAYKSRLAGIKRIINLKKIPKNMMMILDDRKNTGYLSGIYISKMKGVSEDSTIILIRSKGKKKNQVVTFHPGEPILPSKVKSLRNIKKQISVKEAYKLGFRYAKIKAP